MIYVLILHIQLYHIKSVIITVSFVTSGVPIVMWPVVASVPERDWSDVITAPMHRSAKLQTPPNAVDLL